MLEASEDRWNACIDIISADWSYWADSTKDIIVWESQWVAFLYFARKEGQRGNQVPTITKVEISYMWYTLKYPFFIYYNILSPSLFCFLLWFNAACVDVPGGTNIAKYTYKELVRATDNFNQSNKIGEGGFGSVYKVICITFNKETAEVASNLDAFDIQQLNDAGTTQEWNNYCCQGPFVRVKTRSKGVSEWTRGNFWHLTW